MKLIKLVLLVALILPGSSSQAQVRLYLWAWDRAEDLRWVASGVGVAYFAAQLDARDRALIAIWRKAPLRVRPDTSLLPVLHVEGFARHVPRTLDEAAVELWAQALVDAARRTGSRAFQIDFEARSSQKEFYAHVLQRVRQQLPEDWISITALASWCGERAWLARLPVDEIVPMYFRMGPAERQLWHARLAAPATLPARCRQAAGFATDEAGHADLSSTADFHEYLFSPRAWRPAMLEPYLSLYPVPSSGLHYPASNPSFQGVVLP
ncbi:MAG: hypothetical protein P4L87_04775 [Formivibrio sp.]|nr:hypothetical protein [Formivibrio sp.]